jgi:hypothetical protein
MAMGDCLAQETGRYAFLVSDLEGLDLTYLQWWQRQLNSHVN